MESKLKTRNGSFYNLDDLAVLAEQPEGSWLFMGKKRISVTDAAEELSKQLDPDWVSIPCKVARRGTHQGKDYKIWIHPDEIVSVSPHSSVKVSIIFHREIARAFFSPLSLKSVASALEGEQLDDTWEEPLSLPPEDEITGLAEL